ncbi:Uncharacterized protein dnm_065930 [Desulfonema magnum]|uniref:Uncharacterized protein n=1 Tax=Desulfonema magnum TaxID=45655 RepID=A0A975BRT0_9BACT|nr:Uncharacterized protein dnm_065930 [Desulfonema magnum]
MPQIRTFSDIHNVNSGYYMVYILNRHRADRGETSYASG